MLARCLLDASFAGRKRVGPLPHAGRVIGPLERGGGKLWLLLAI